MPALRAFAPCILRRPAGRREKFNKASTPSGLVCTTAGCTPPANRSEAVKGASDKV